MLICSVRPPCTNTGNNRSPELEALLGSWLLRPSQLSRSRHAWWSTPGIASGSWLLTLPSRWWTWWRLLGTPRHHNICTCQGSLLLCRGWTPTVVITSHCLVLSLVVIVCRWNIYIWWQTKGCISTLHTKSYTDAGGKVCWAESFPCGPLNVTTECLCATSQQLCAVNINRMSRHSSWHGVSSNMVRGCKPHWLTPT